MNYQIHSETEEIDQLTNLQYLSLNNNKLISLSKRNGNRTSDNLQQLNLYDNKLSLAKCQMPNETR